MPMAGLRLDAGKYLEGVTGKLLAEGFTLRMHQGKITFCLCIIFFE